MSCVGTSGRNLGRCFGLGLTLADSRRAPSRPRRRSSPCPRRGGAQAGGAIVRGAGAVSPADRDEQSGRAALLRSGPDARLRLQSRRGDPLVRRSGAARPGGGHAALGHRAGARREHQLAGRSRARGPRLRRRAEGARAGEAARPPVRRQGAADKPAGAPRWKRPTSMRSPRATARIRRPIRSRSLPPTPRR